MGWGAETRQRTHADLCWEEGPRCAHQEADNVLNKDDEWDVSPARLVFTALRPPCEESTSATLQKGAMLEGRPRQGPQAGGVRVFPASTHSQWPKF